MSLADVFASIEADKFNMVMGDTWGHLAPKPREKYEGTILFALGDYNDAISINTDFGDLPNSPWFYQDLHEFIGTYRPRTGNECGVFLFTGYYIKFKNGKNRFSGKIVRIKCIPKSKR